MAIIQQAVTTWDIFLSAADGLEVLIPFKLFAHRQSGALIVATAPDDNGQSMHILIRKGESSLEASTHRAETFLFTVSASPQDEPKILCPICQHELDCDILLRHPEAMPKAGMPFSPKETPETATVSSVALFRTGSDPLTIDDEPDGLPGCPEFMAFHQESIQALLVELTESPQGARQHLCFRKTAEGIAFSQHASPEHLGEECEECCEEFAKSVVGTIVEQFRTEEDASDAASSERQ